MSINITKADIPENLKIIAEYLIHKGLPEELTGNPILNMGYTYKYPFHIPAIFSYPTIALQDGATTLYGSGYYIMCYGRIIDNNKGLVLKINKTQYSNKNKRIPKEETALLTQEHELFRLTDALKEYIDFSSLPEATEEQIRQVKNATCILTPDEIKKIATKFQTIDINSGMDAIIDINNFLSVEELYRLFTTAKIPICLLDHEVRGGETTQKYVPGNTPVDEKLYEKLIKMGIQGITFDCVEEGPVRIKSIYRPGVKGRQ